MYSWHVIHQVSHAIGSLFTSVTYNWNRGKQDLSNESEVVTGKTHWIGFITFPDLNFHGVLKVHYKRVMYC